MTGKFKDIKTLDCADINYFLEISRNMNRKFLSQNISLTSFVESHRHPLDIHESGSALHSEH